MLAGLVDTNLSLSAPLGEFGLATALSLTEPSFME